MTYNNKVPSPINKVARIIFRQRSPFLSKGFDLAPQFPQQRQQQKHRPHRGIKTASSIKIATITNKPT